MRSIVLLCASVSVLSSICFSQTKPKPKPTTKAAAKTSASPAAKPIAKTPVKPPVKSPVKPSVDMGKLIFRSYRNKTFGFSVTFPDNWLIHEGDFAKQPVAVEMKAPELLPLSVKTDISQAIKRVHVLLTAYLLTPVSEESAVVRISVEDLSANPQIKDAVDYFDAIRAMYTTMKLPVDFKYSETKVEKLGVNQFGFLDTSFDAGKKRMYATVRNGFAVMFTVSYERDDDLRSLRRVLERGNFGVK